LKRSTARDPFLAPLITVSVRDGSSYIIVTDNFETEEVSWRMMRHHLNRLGKPSDEEKRT
jgi:hypothetical protein